MLKTAEKCNPILLLFIGAICYMHCKVKKQKFKENNSDFLENPVKKKKGKSFK